MDLFRVQGSREARYRLQRARALPDSKRECTYLGYRIPVPPKQKARAWTALQAQLSRERIGRDVQQHQLEVRRRHELEQEISRLESMPSNPGRTRAITLLRRRLGGPDA